jgi:hypothetical protein
MCSLLSDLCGCEAQPLLVFKNQMRMKLLQHAASFASIGVIAVITAFTVQVNGGRTSTATVAAVPAAQHTFTPGTEDDMVKNGSFKPDTSGIVPGSNHQAQSK